MKNAIKLFKKIIGSYLPSDLNGVPPYEVERMRVTVGISVIGGSIGLMMALLRLNVEGFKTNTWFFLVGISIVAIIGPLIIKVTKKYVFYTYILMTFVALVITVRAAATGGVTSAAITWFYIIPVMSGIITGIRGAIYTTIVCVIGVWTVYFLPELGITSVHQTSVLVNSIVLCFGLLAMGGFCVHYESEKQSHQDHVVKVNNLISSQERFASLGRMSSSIAHEVNNPLGVIALNLMSLKEMAQILEDDPSLEKRIIPRIKTKIENATASITHIKEVIETLKDFALNTEIKQETIAISQLSKQVEASFSHLLQQHRISFEVDYHDPGLAVNKRVFDRILSNLIKNSIDAIEKLEERWIKLETGVEKDYFYVKLTDSGKGIEAGVADKIFEPFFTTKDVGKGTGLGLGLCKVLIERIGGHIELDASCSNTRFVVRYPTSEYK